MSPTVRGALALGLVALSGLVLPPALGVLALLAVGAAIAVDALAARRPPPVTAEIRALWHAAFPRRCGCTPPARIAD